uniref:SH2 domain-containing adapter protein D n=1 Tax=Anopheles atroparvus TaxID=41427 RepID=A0AAG5DQZ5_ANOAO
MERVWRKVNQGLTLRSSSSKVATGTGGTGSGGGGSNASPAVPPAIPVTAVASAGAASGFPHSTDTTSSAGFGESQVVAVQRRRSVVPQASTASSEKRRRRRRRSRPSREGTSSQAGHSSGGHHKGHSSSGRRGNNTQSVTIAQQSNEQSLRQRAVARLKMFNFNLNWDLHMTQCKPCGPKSGNIITRRLCRNRRGEDNELYRSNSFKFERFERKDPMETGTRTMLRKQISVCDDYSLPLDFVKKRPSSFDPCLVQHIPNNWASPSPQSDHVSFLEPLILQQPLSAVPTINNNIPGSGTNLSGNPATVGTLGGHPPPLPPEILASRIVDAATAAAANTVAIKTVEEIFDTHRSYKATGRHRARSRSRRPESCSEVKYINQNFSSGSSAPITSEEEDNDDEEDELSKIPELNSPDSISDDLVQPLPLRQSPIKTTGPNSSIRNPSPYYYSDLLKNKQQQQQQHRNHEDVEQLDSQEPAREEADSKRRVSSISGAGNIRQGREVGVRYKKSSSLDTPGAEKEVCIPKRYSITEEGVRIIRCDSPSTTTSDDSDCSECRKRRAWHAQALAIARANCNLGPLFDATSMPPHRLLGPAAVCACVTPAFGEDNDELFRPRSIFYVHQPGATDCADCSLSDPTVLPPSTTTADEMANVRTRQIYETAFDSKITRSDDDLDEVDRITNQSVLLQLTKSNSSSASNMVSASQGRNKRLDSKRTKSATSKTPSTNPAAAVPAGNLPDAAEAGNQADQLAQDLQEKLQIDKQMDNIANANSTSSSQLPLRGYTPSPPSTAPLPMKFPGKHERFFINSIKSAPNLPASNVGAQHPRLKDLRLDIQNVRNNEVPSGSCDGGMNDGPFAHNSKVGERPRSTLCLEPERVLELKRGHRSAHHHHGKQQQPHHQQRGRNFSSTESMATSSSGGSMESLKSSTSEGNRSTSSSDSRHSSSLSSHSSDSGPSMAFPLRVPVVVHNKLNILSPISDKSSQEPGSETSDINNRNNNSQKQSPVDGTVPASGTGSVGGTANTGTLKKDGDECASGAGLVGTEAVKSSVTKRRSAPNKTLLLITGPEIQGSDSGISLHSREDLKSRTNFLNLGIQRASMGLEKQNDHGKAAALPQDLHDLPFDMPKLRRRRAHLQQEPCTSGSVTSVDVGDLPFDMPKLRRRLRMSQNQQQQHQLQQQQQQLLLQQPFPTAPSTSAGMLLQTSTESSGLSQASSSLSMRESDNKLAMGGGIFKQSLTLNLNECGSRPPKKFGTLDLGLNLGSNRPHVDLIDASIPLDRQGWYHGSISRIDAEKILRPLSEGSFLVRNSESTRQDYSLTLKSAKGFMHMRIQRDADSGQFILGQFSRPFPTIPDMIRHFCLNRLPVRGAEHMCLLEPVIAQIL